MKFNILKIRALMDFFGLPFWLKYTKLLLLVYLNNNQFSKSRINSTFTVAIVTKIAAKVG